MISVLPCSWAAEASFFFELIISILICSTFLFEKSTETYTINESHINAHNLELLRRERALSIVMLRELTLIQQYFLLLDLVND